VRSGWASLADGEARKNKCLPSDLISEERASGRKVRRSQNGSQFGGTESRMEPSSGHREISLNSQKKGYLGGVNLHKQKQLGY